MSKMEKVRALRDNPDVHYNCAQAVFIPFAKAKGLDADTAYRIAMEFGAGMGMGASCGALTGALMVLGLYDGTTERRAALIRAFRETHDGVTDCAQLLKLNHEKGNTDKKAHCDRMVYDAVRLLEEMLDKV